jgi:hypothetical protein
VLRFLSFSSSDELEDDESLVYIIASMVIPCAYIMEMSIETYLALLSAFVSSASTFRAALGSEARVSAGAAENQEDDD